MRRTHSASVALLALLVMMDCGPKPSAADEGRIRDARMFTQRYSHSRLSAWKVRARAAGTDCAVLFITTSMVLQDSMIEAMHYGAGAYDIYEGGVNHFYRERSFRGVAYQDRSGRVWTFGAVEQAEAERLRACGT